MNVVGNGAERMARTSFDLHPHVVFTRFHCSLSFSPFSMLLFRFTFSFVREPRKIVRFHALFPFVPDSLCVPFKIHPYKPHN